MMKPQIAALTFPRFVSATCTKQLNHRNHQHYHVSRKTSGHRPPPRFAKQIGPATRIHHIPTTWTRSSRSIYSETYRHCVFQSLDAKWQLLGIISYKFSERCAPPTATWLWRFFEQFDGVSEAPNPHSCGHAIRAGTKEQAYSFSEESCVQQWDIPINWDEWMLLRSTNKPRPEGQIYSKVSLNTTYTSITFHRNKTS